VDLATGGLDLLDQRRELVAVAAAGEYRKALGGNFLAISPPMKSPAPMTATVLFLFCMGFSGLCVALAPADPSAWAAQRLGQFAFQNPPDRHQRKEH
jgi:hypothetical protein